MMALAPGLWRDSYGKSIIFWLYRIEFRVSKALISMMAGGQLVYFLALLLAVFLKADGFPQHKPHIVKFSVRTGWLEDFFARDSNLGDFGDGFDESSESDLIRRASDLNAEAEAAKGFDGAELRRLINSKWDEDFDVEFTQTEYMGRASLYLNVMPWTLDKEPCRHVDEEAYLEHLEAVAERLVRWGRVSLIKDGIASTTKRPRRGTIPLKTVPLRLNLDDSVVRSFSGSAS